MWNPFKRRGREQPPQAAPPAQAPTRPAEAGPAPRPGRLRRLFGRKPKQAQPPAAPPEAPTPAPARAGQAPPAGGGEGRPRRDYPNSLPVSGTGTWKISSTRWVGTASGILTGAAVRVFIDAMEAGDTETPTFLIATAYDDGSGFADMLDLSETSIDISYG